MAERGPIGLLALIGVERQHQDPGSKAEPGATSVTRNAIAERFAVRRKSPRAPRTPPWATRCWPGWVRLGGA